MKIGDPKKVIVLGVVAVCAVGYLMIAMLGSRAKAPKAAANPALPTVGALPEAPVSTANEASLHLVRNSFGTTDSVAAPPIQFETPDPTPETMPELRLPTREIEGGLVPVRVELPPPVSEDPPPPDRHLKQRLRVRLTGIVDAGEPVAYVQIGEGEPQAVRLGQTLVDGVRVERLSAMEIVLKSKSEQHRLAVGEEIELTC